MYSYIYTHKHNLLIKAGANIHVRNYITVLLGLLITIAHLLRIYYINYPNISPYTINRVLIILFQVSTTYIDRNSHKTYITKQKATENWLAAAFHASPDRNILLSYHKIDPLCDESVGEHLVRCFWGVDAVPEHVPSRVRARPDRLTIAEKRRRLDCSSSAAASPRLEEA